jgi:hypothetical protein
MTGFQSRLSAARSLLWRNRLAAAWGALMFLLLAQLGIGFTSDWRHLHDDDGMHYSVIAYSHLQGVAETGFHNAYRDPLSGEIVGRYLHHPPLLGLSIAAVFKVTGLTGYWVPRALSVFFHLIVMACVSYLAWRLTGRRAGALLLTAGLFALLPVSTYFGKAVVYPPITLAFSLLGVVGHFHALERLRLRHPRWWRPWLAALPAWLLAAFSGWFSHFLLAACGAQALAAVVQTRGMLRQRILMLAGGYAAAGASGIGLVALHMYLVGGLDAFADFIAVYRARSGAEEIAVMGAEYTAYAARAVTLSTVRLLAFVPAVLTVVWLALAVRRALRGALSYADVWTFTLLVPGPLYILAASRGATQHPFYAYFLLPGVVLATVQLLLEGWERYLHLTWRQKEWARLGAGLALGVSIVTAAVVLWQQYRTDDPFALDRVASLQIRMLVPPGQRMFPPRVMRSRLPAFEARPGGQFRPTSGADMEGEQELARSRAGGRGRV